MMKSSTQIRSKSTCGFSLVETSVALGLFSMLIMPVLGLITAGVTHSHKALDQSALHAVHNSLRIRLSDQPAWPPAASSPEWTAALPFARDGSILTGHESHAAFTIVRMSASSASAFPSTLLEVVRCEFLNPRDESIISTCVIQRLREP